MFKARRYAFCPTCGSRCEYRIPADDNRERAICTACGEVHYENPINVVGTLPVWGEQVLLCKRAIEPRLGLWTLPAGFLEIGESVADGAARETSEEAGAQFELQELYTLINVVKVAQIHLFHRARLLSPEFDPGPETLEARLFHEHEVPWDQIAFRTTRMTLEHFFEDRRAGRGFPVHTGDI
jgi:ADP-ribose pyrophosphatase YjhB (NUDIX family)